MSGRADYIRTVPGLAELLARQAGLARRSQLRQLGVVDWHVTRQLEAGRWRLVAPEVVSCDNGRLDREQLRWRGVLHAPTGWVAGRSALETWGLVGYEPESVHVLVPRDARPTRLTGVVLHVTDRLDGLIHSLAAGLPRTAAARSVVDAAAWSDGPRRATGVVVAALQQGLVTAHDVDRELAGAGRIHHKVAVRAALAGAEEGGESVSEIDVGPLLRRAGLTTFRRQVRRTGRRSDIEVELPDGSILVVEVDGPTHDTPEGRWRDSERDAEVAADGKLQLRLPSYAVRADPSGVVRRLVRIREAAEHRRDSR